MIVDRILLALFIHKFFHSLSSNYTSIMMKSCRLALQPEQKSVISASSKQDPPLPDEMLFKIIADLNCQITSDVHHWVKWVKVSCLFARFSRHFSVSVLTEGVFKTSYCAASSPSCTSPSDCHFLTLIHTSPNSIKKRGKGVEPEKAERVRSTSCFSYL